MGAPSKSKNRRKTKLTDDPIYKIGYEEGEAAMRVKALTFLEQKYMSDEVERDTPYAKAILEIAGELSKHLELKKS